MCKIVFLLALCITVVAALPEQQRIAGGSLATLGQHPYSAVVLYTQNNANFQQRCGGAIINNRSLLSATSCWVGNNNFPNNFRVRVGSLNVTAGGSLHTVAQIISHPYYNSWNQDNNIGILRVGTIIVLGTNVRPVPIAGPNYNLPDYQHVWAIGWGRTTPTGTATSEQLRRVEVMTVNQGRCENIYGVNFLTHNMMCAGWQTASRGSCLGDIGSPLIHNNVAVGVTSFAIGCGDVNYPAIYSRIPRYTAWIQTNA